MKKSTIDEIKRYASGNANSPRSKYYDFFLQDGDLFSGFYRSGCGYSHPDDEYRAHGCCSISPIEEDRIITIFEKDKTYYYGLRCEECFECRICKEQCINSSMSHFEKVCDDCFAKGE